ncbi:MAG: hypothetical protein AAF713_10660 [Pseudomonadota bacterium]
MRNFVWIAGALLVAACAEPKVEAPKPTVPTNLTRADCYTVELFDPVEIEVAAEDVPPEYSRFLGDWHQGAWNGQWCHDLMVTKVHFDGRAEIFEMHAPFEPLGQPATAFRRVGRINENGELRFAYGTETLTYTLVQGKLIAKRSGIHGDMQAVLTNRNAPADPPEPRPTEAGVASEELSKL